MASNPAITKYEKAFMASQQFLAALGIGRFPLDVFALPRLIKGHYGHSITLSSLAEFNSYRRQIGAPAYHVTDGECRFVPEGQAYNIIYNGGQNFQRVRFTIMHEIAHIILGHVGQNSPPMGRAIPQDPLQLRYEGEANTFASNALAPPILIHTLLEGKAFDPVKVQRCFHISGAAARAYRKQDYDAWLTTRPFIHSSEYQLHSNFMNQTYTRHCNRCGATRLGFSGSHCPICGQKGLLSGPGTREYSKVQTNPSGPAPACPHCSTPGKKGSPFCPCCGLYVVNLCTNRQCQAPAQADARFCIHCGGQTTFYCDGLLPNWNQPQPKPKAAFSWITWY